MVKGMTNEVADASVSMVEAIINTFNLDTIQLAYVICNAIGNRLEVDFHNESDVDHFKDTLRELIGYIDDHIE